MKTIATHTQNPIATTLEKSESDEVIIATEKLNLFYADKQALFDINMDVLKNKVTALIGPSGCGKSTLLRCCNRINDLIDNIVIQGKILFERKNIFDADVDVSKLRSNIGMVFQKPNPFPKTIFDNVAYGLKIQGISNKTEIKDKVETAIKDSGLWKEVAHRLNENALGLSGGQQQRLVIARSIAIQPKILLLDEPTSSLDPISTAAIEELVFKLRTKFTIIIVTHNMQQAARVADYTAFMYLGKLIEYADSGKLFTSPQVKQTEDYITGRFG